MCFPLCFPTVNTCVYCTFSVLHVRVIVPKMTVDFKEIVNSLVTKHCNKEIKFNKFDGSYLRALNFKIIPELCGERGREITLNENKETITRQLKSYEVHVLF